MKFAIKLLVLTALLSACGNEKNGNYALSTRSETSILGSWENVGVEVYTHSKKDSNMEVILNVSEENWEKEMKFKPIVTTFNDDHTYISEYRNLEDSVFRVVKGTWELMGDSLYLDQTIPSWESYAYKFSLKNGLAVFESILDWDGDGVKDEKYLGTQRKTY